MNYTNSDMSYTPWCYMPPEMHFKSPQDLKEAFWHFMESRIPAEMRSDRGQRFLPPIGKFEKVKTAKGKYILVPTTIDYSFLFRGQTRFFDRCVPSLYRYNFSEEEIMIERMRCVEFENYLLQLPQIKDFQKRHLSIDFVGLAQHYGILTDVVDLTSSLDVALFFAMCNPSADGNSYECQDGEGEHIGYIYAIDTCDFNQRNGQPQTLFDGKISAIGMQPFDRPGSQRGFSIRLAEDETLTGLLYSFTYTNEDSKAILDYFNGGKTLWHEDAVTDVARQIRHSMVFSYNTMNTCLKRYVAGSGKSRRQMKIRLQDKGCQFRKESLWSVKGSELAKLEEEYAQHGGFVGLNDVVERKCISGDKRYSCVTTAFLAQSHMTSFPTSGCKAPEGYDSPYEYSKSHDGKVWGYSRRQITQDAQTKPNPSTGKVEEWEGDWHSLAFAPRLDNPIKMQFVKVPRTQ